MKNRITSAILALLIALSVMPFGAFAAEDDAEIDFDTAVQAPDNGEKLLFSDLDGKAYKDAALYWGEKGVFNGGGDGTFDGDDTTTFAQLAKIVAVVFGLDTDGEIPNSFLEANSAVVKGAWYVKYLYALRAAGVISSDGIKPEENATFEDAIVMLAKAGDLKQKKSAFTKSQLGGKDKIPANVQGYYGAFADIGADLADKDGNAKYGAISRGELSMLLSGLVAEYVTEDGTYNIDEKGLVIVAAGKSVVLKGEAQNNIIITAAAEDTTVVVSANAPSVIINAKGADAVINGDVQFILVAGENADASLKGSSAFVQVTGKSAKTTIYGHADEICLQGEKAQAGIFMHATVSAVTVMGKENTVSAEGVVDRLLVARGSEGTEIVAEIGGEITDAVVAGKDASFTGIGVVKTVEARGADISVITPKTQVTAAEMAQNVTNDSGKVEAGTTSVNGGTYPIVINGNGTASYIPGEPASLPEISKQPVGGTVKYTLVNKTLSVEATVEEGNTLSYQWYKNDQPIKNATEKTYAIPQKEEAGTHSYYCLITSKNDISGLTKDLASDTAEVVVDNSSLKVLMIGGTSLMSGRRSHFALEKMLNTDGGIDSASLKSISLDGEQGRMDQLFSWSGTDITGHATSSKRKGIIEEIEKVLSEDASVKYDYVIVSVSADFTLVPYSKSYPYAKREVAAVEYLEGLMYAHNPDGCLMVAAPQGYIHEKGSDKAVVLFDKPNTFTIGSNYAGHTVAIAKQADSVVEELNKNDIDLLVKSIKLGQVYLDAYEDGINAYQTYKRTWDTNKYYYYPSDIMSFLLAATCFTEITGISANDITVKTWYGNATSGNSIQDDIDAGAFTFDKIKGIVSSSMGY